MKNVSLVKLHPLTKSIKHQFSLGEIRGCFVVIGAVDNGVGRNRITEARMPTERVCSIEIPRFTP